MNFVKKLQEKLTVAVLRQVAIILVTLIILVVLCFNFHTMESRETPVITSPHSVDIVIVVQVEYSTLYSCINSLIRHQADFNLLKQRIILVRNNAPESSEKYLKTLCVQDNIFCTDTEEQNHRYINAVKQGLNFSKSNPINGKESDSVVILNPNTMVTEGWLIALYNALNSKNFKVGIVGPILNAGTYQSVPNIFQYYPENKKTGWHENKLPPGLDIDNLGRKIRHYVHTNKVKLVKLDVLNGQCIMFRRSLIEKIGFSDDFNLPREYGEEVDFCLRAVKAGYHNFVVPSSYVVKINIKEDYLTMDSAYKNTTESYLKDKFGVKFIENINNKLTKSTTELSDLRKFIETLYKTYENSFLHIKKSGSILFVLHDIAVAGGIVSVLQESLQMYRYGVKVAFSFPAGSANYYWEDKIRAILTGTSETTWRKLVVEHKGKTVFPEVHPSFYEMAKDFDVVVATYCFTMIQVQNLVLKYPKIMPAYYVQDYEPWFWYSPFQPNRPSNSWEAQFARSTYEAFNKTLNLFGKTHWTMNMVSSHHNVSFHKVHASIDHKVYFPNHTEISVKLKKTWRTSRFRVIAMIRPSTPRRNPENTLEILLRLAYSFPDQINITTFGCDPNDIKGIIYNLRQRLGPSAHRNLSVLQQSNIQLLGVISDRVLLAHLYQQSDMFIDASWWQAFGRAGLEAMACGTLSIMPSTGAAPEICGIGISAISSAVRTLRVENKEKCKRKGNEKNCIFQEYCLFHDGNDIEGFYQKALTLLQDDKRRRSLIISGMERTYHFTPEAAAASIADNLLGELGNYRKNENK